jgi:PAS domain S-box-containing protein
MQQAMDPGRDSEVRFRAIFENAAVGIARVSLDGRFLECNQRFCNIAGYSCEELLSKTFRDITHPDDLALQVRDVERILTGEITAYAREKRYCRKDGSVAWVYLSVSLLRDADGSPSYFIGVIEDITARKEAIEKLRASEEQFRVLADTAPVMIWAAGPDKLCTFFNKRWLDFTGRTMEQELGNGWTEGVHPDDYDQCFGIYGASFDAKIPFVLEYRLCRHDGEYRWLMDHGVPQFSLKGDFVGYIGSCMDITERKQAEAEQAHLEREQAARAAAEAANNAKDEFLAIVSHELRSPLTAILGYTRLLRTGVGMENIDKAAAVIDRNAKVQLQIIEDLLDSARIITGKLRIQPVPLNFVSVLDAALETMRSAAEAKGVTLVTNYRSEPEAVLGDPERLQQVVSNLLSNAIKFTPAGGQVELRMESGVDHVQVTITDNGQGIEPEFLPFVFDRFRQADPASVRRTGGLGLGLSLVKYLVELHSGMINAMSEGRGHGSTFTVRLPRREAQLLASASPPALSEVRTKGAFAFKDVPSLQGVDLLVVDDQEEARATLAETLGEYGAHVTTASSGSNALAYLGDLTNDKPPDVLIVDIAMPEEDGYAVLKRVRALETARGGVKAHHVPAVALTALGRSEDRLRAFQAGFQMHLAKPVEPAELVIVIDSLTNRRR